MTTIQFSLRKLSMLADLPDPVLQQLSKKFKYIKFQKDQYVIRKGDPSNSMIFLIEGELQVMDVNENGQNIWLATVFPGASAGEIGLITGESRTASLVTVRDSIVAVLPKKDALELIVGHPSVASRVMQHLAKIIKNNNIQLALINLPSAQERIEAILSQRIVRYSSGDIVIENLPPQESIATMANTSRETVSRIINKLIKEGVLEKDQNRKRYFVKKPEKLKDLTK